MLPGKNPDKKKLSIGRRKPVKRKSQVIWRYDPDDFNDLKSRIEGKKFVVALSAGKLKLGCHLPLLRLIEVLGVRVDELWGVSAGSIVGGLWASGYTAKQIESELESLNHKIMFDFFNIHALKSGWEALRRDKLLKTAGLFPGLAVEKHIRHLLEKDKTSNPNLDMKDFYSISYNISKFQKTVLQSIDENTIQHYIPLEDGSFLVYKTHGDVADIIRASMSLSGIYWPKELGGDFFLDGGITEHLPIRTPFVKWFNDVKNKVENRDLFILALEASFWDEKSPVMANPLSIISESFEILGVELSMDNEFYIRNLELPLDRKIDLEIIRPGLPYVPLTRIPDFIKQIRESKRKIQEVLADR